MKKSVEIRLRANVVADILSSIESNADYYAREVTDYTERLADDPEDEYIIEQIETNKYRLSVCNEIAKLIQK